MKPENLYGNSIRNIFPLAKMERLKFPGLSASLIDNPKVTVLMA